MSEEHTESPHRADTQNTRRKPEASQ